jgi:GTP-binding protein
MEIESAVFIGSYTQFRDCPADGRPEYAFIGRSNVGKSSLINMLLGRKNLARTSNTPGKTQLLNYFLINDQWYVVDLPGYGYARVSKKKRRSWEHMIHSYFINRLSLQCAVVLIDAMIPPQDQDIEFINWLGEKRIPFIIVYTKTDRLREDERQENIQKIRQALLNYWETLPPQFETSARKGWGREELLDFFAQVNAKTKEEW